MSEQVYALEGKPLSQAERVVDTFVAPSKAFTDILRSTSWWLPFLLIAIFAALTAFAIDKKVGYEAVTEQAMEQNSFAQEQMAKLSPDVRATAIKRQAVSTKVSSYLGGVFVLIIVAIAALLNWATINFGFAGKTTFGQNMAVQMYASLPLMLKYLLTAVLLFAGVNLDHFNARNPVGTNPGFYLQDSAPWLKTLLSFVDFFGLWSVLLAILGLAIISRKSKATAAIVVVGWWLVSVFVITGLAAAFS
jgi:hypothetical protein